jgi:hypothetical protein
MPKISVRGRRWLPVVMLPVLMMTAAALAAGSFTAQASVRPAAHPAGPTRPAGHLVIREVLVGHSRFVEGSVGFVRIERPSGRKVLTRRLPLDDPRITVPLRPGRYRLKSWQRPCDANCGTLDPPTDRCSRMLTIRSGERLRAIIRLNPATGCVIRLRR